MDVDAVWVENLIAIDSAILLVLLCGAVWSVVIPGKRIWQSPGGRSWQQRLTWALFYLTFVLNAALLIQDWNTWHFKNSLRFVLSIPLILIGALLVTWGNTTLGLDNTSGLNGGFIFTGPYRFTRNPQYLGDMLLFIGLSLAANSLYLWVAHLLTILVFVIAPLAEEPWLEEQYGEAYLEYKRITPRFL